MTNEGDISNVVIRALNNKNYRWRTIGGVAKEAGIPEDSVVKAISMNQDFVVRATVLSKEGEPLFTTREHLLESATLGEKLLGALKNRVY